MDLRYEDLALLEGETVQLVLQRSKVTLFWSCVVCALFFWFFFIPIFKVVRDFKDYNDTVYAVTDRRIVAKLAWPKGQYHAKNLVDVTTVEVHQTAGGKMGGYGALTISGADKNKIYLKNLKNPAKAKADILRIAGAVKGSVA